MKTLYLKMGNCYKVANDEQMNMHEALPPGNYVVKQNPMTHEYYLEHVESFSIKHKLYGDTTKNASRILRTFADRDNSTGVMLAGEKGSGKTLLTKRICMDAAEKGIPTIIINHPHNGDMFNAFMQMIQQPAIILFDEFEKVYDSEEQQAILTLLDGVFPSKKLFLLTCNDKFRVDMHMRNRPGRIFYMFNFDSLSAEFILEYCNDNLKNKEHTENLVKMVAVFDKFNFDMLKAIVEEMNRYDETPQQVVKILNTKPEFSTPSRFTVEDVYYKGVKIPEEKQDTKQWQGLPLVAQHLDIQVWLPSKSTDPEDEEYENIRFTPADLKSIEAFQDKLTFVNKEGSRMTLKKEKQTYYSYGEDY